MNTEIEEQEYIEYDEMFPTCFNSMYKFVDITDFDMQNPNAKENERLESFVDSLPDGERTALIAATIMDDTIFLLWLGEIPKGWKYRRKMTLKWENLNVSNTVRKVSCCHECGCEH